jgi:hypothetical protein
VVSGTEQKNSTSLFLPWMSITATKGLTVSPSEIDCNQMAMGLPARGRLGGISETPLLPLRGSSVMCVCTRSFFISSNTIMAVMGLLFVMSAVCNTDHF